MAGGWWLICIGAVITLLFCAIFSVENGVLHHLMCALVAVTISLIVILILATDRPFDGMSRISTEPQHVLDTRLSEATPPS